MLKRLGLGLLKGLVIGGGIGAGLQYGLPGIFGSGVGGLLGFLIAMGVAGTTGIFAGKPPWHEGAWIEASLKGLVGVGLGALTYWVASRWGQFSIPFPGLAQPASWTSLPVVFAPAIAGVYGSLVELDNTGDDKSDSQAKKGPKARVAIDDDLELEEEEATRRPASKKRQA